MTDRYQRDPRTGRFSRPVANVDAESAYGPMADSIEDISNVSATDVRPGFERPRHAPEADELAQGGYGPVVRFRRAVLAHPEDQGHHNEFLRTAARSSGPMDPTAYLTGLDDGLTPEARADALARRQAPPQVTIHGDADAG